VGSQTIFFPFQVLQDAEIPLELQLGGTNVFVHYKKNAHTAWAEDESGRLLPGVLAYKDGWLDFNPNSDVYKTSSVSK
jgi:hypothetical protein